MRPRLPLRTMATMFAQLIEAQVGRARLAVLEQVVRRELIPALRNEPGFCGAMSMSDRGRGTTLLVLFWETEGQAGRPLAAGVVPFVNASSTVSELLGADSYVVTIWDVDARS